MREAVGALSEMPQIKAKIGDNGDNIDVFRADLGVLKGKGVDVGEARRLLKAWNGDA